MLVIFFGVFLVNISWGCVVCYLCMEFGVVVLLVIVMVVVLVWVNLLLFDVYFVLWYLDVGFDFGLLGMYMDLYYWVNDGLMVVFFFLIGLEVC